MRRSGGRALTFIKMALRLRKVSYACDANIKRRSGGAPSELPGSNWRTCVTKKKSLLGVNGAHHQPRRRTRPLILINHGTHDSITMGKYEEGCRE